MKLTVPVRYEASHIPPRCKKAREIHIHEAHEVEIREAALADAPVAVRYALRRGDPGIELRWWDGRLWAPLKDGLEAARERLGGVNAWMALSRDRDQAEADPGTGFLYDCGKALAAKREADALAERLLLLDGVVHESAPEPYWDGHVLGSGHALLTLKTWDPEHTTPLDSTQSFRADQLELGKEVMSAIGFVDQTPDVNGRCDVLLPEALRLDPRAAAFRKGLAEATKGLSDLTGLLANDRTPGRAGAVGETIGATLHRLALDLGWSRHERMAVLAGLSRAFSDDNQPT